MRGFKTAASLIAVGAALGVPAAGVAKQPKHPSVKLTHPSHTRGLTEFVFRGVLAAVPAPGATTLQVQINAGNPAATAKLGTSAGTTATLAVSAATSAMRWNATKTPLASSLTSFQVGDPVAVTVWAPKNTALAQLLVTPASRVDDYLFSTKPHGRLFIFFGNAVSVDQTAHTVTMNVTKTNWRAGYAIRTAGASATQTFSYDASKTVFVHWRNNKPHLIGADKIAAGDALTIRVFSPTYDSKLSTLLALPAWRVNDHEPMSLLKSAIASANGHTL
jgi:hypothetical protein